MPAARPCASPPTIPPTSPAPNGTSISSTGGLWRRRSSTCYVQRTTCERAHVRRADVLTCIRGDMLTYPVSCFRVDFRRCSAARCTSARPHVARGTWHVARRHVSTSDEKHVGTCVRSHVGTCARRPSHVARALPPLLPRDADLERLQGRGGPVEQFVGKPGRVIQHVGVDDVALVEIQSEARKVLEPQVA